MLSGITERDRLDERLSCLKVMFGATIGMNVDSVDWLPDDLPPTTRESIVWLWFCRPDQAALFYTAANFELRRLMVMYEGQRLDYWFAQQIEELRNENTRA
jgi:hypothetical protein